MQKAREAKNQKREGTKMNMFIGENFTVKGLVTTSIVQVEGFYYLSGNKKYPSLRCKRIANDYNEKIGERENFLYKDVVKNGNLISTIKVLAR